MMRAILASVLVTAAATAVEGRATDPLTGSVLPGRRGVLQGYTAGETLPPTTTGEGEWTGEGPWGGNVRALAACPADSSVAIVGCGFSMATDAGGVWRSIDGGYTWSETDLQGMPVNDACAAGPAAPQTFYAATRTGLYVSADQGSSWTLVPGLGSSYVIGIGVNVADPDLLIAGLSSGEGIRRSTDGGETWEEVGLSEGYMKGFGTDPNNPDTMYVAMSGLDYPLYRSMDGGSSWSPMGPAGSGWGLLACPGDDSSILMLTHDDGYYLSGDYGSTWGLAVEGSSYAPAVFDGEYLYAPVIGEGVWESPDGGINWGESADGIVASYWQAGCAASTGYLAGHYGGVYLETDPMEGFTVSQTGIDNAFIHAVSYSEETGRLLAGGDYHGLWMSNDGGQTWELSGEGLENWTIYGIWPETDLHYGPDTLWAATGDGVYRSSNGGETWLNAGLEGTQVSDIVFDPSDPDRAWAGTASSGVSYTTDGGATWQESSGLPFALYPSLDLLPMRDSLRVLLSYQQLGDGVYYSDDGGASFDLAVGPAGSYRPGLSTRWSDNRAYCATDGGVWRSDDGGETWESCPGSSGLLWSVMGTRDENVFAGTNGNGVSWSPDGGDSWQPLNQGIENMVVWDVVYGGSGNQLFAGLRGHGVVEITEDQLGVEEGPAENGGMTAFATPSPASAQVRLRARGVPAASRVNFLVYDFAGRVMHDAEAVASGGSAECVWTPGEGVASGVYLIRARGDGAEAGARLVLIR